MDKTFVISAVIVILIIITYYLAFSPSQRRERRLSKEQKEGEVKKMHLRQKDLQEMHYGKVLLLFLGHKEVYLMDEEHKRVSDFDKSIISLTFFKENNFIKIIPVIITGIELFKDSDFDMVVEFNISDQWYDLKIVFIDKLVVVAYSSLLGTITLYLNQCPQAEIGKMIKVKVTQKRFHSLLNKIEVKVKHSLGRYTTKLFRITKSFFYKRNLMRVLAVSVPRQIFLILEDHQVLDIQTVVALLLSLLSR